MTTYVDGFVVAVRSTDKEIYRAFCRKMSALFKEYGALEVVDCWGDDVPPGKLTSFPLAVKAQADETVCFGYTTWPSREARQAAWKRIESDPRMKEGASPPFDGKRMIYGGFEMISS